MIWPLLLGIVAFDLFLWAAWARPTSLSAAEANLKVAVANLTVCIGFELWKLFR